MMTTMTIQITTSVHFLMGWVVSCSGTHISPIELPYLHVQSASRSNISFWCLSVSPSSSYTLFHALSRFPSSRFLVVIFKRLDIPLPWPILSALRYLRSRRRCIYSFFRHTLHHAAPVTMPHVYFQRESATYSHVCVFFLFAILADPVQFNLRTFTGSPFTCDTL
ncbi:hypothetical protein V8E53_010381 [Lactarius tabidus]